jgi:lysophospholipase L1-like esterase
MSHLSIVLCIIVTCITGCGSRDAPGTTDAQVVFLGDSITARWNPLPVAGAANFGVSGETSEQIAARMPDVIRARAQMVYILAGTNDILKAPVATIDYVQSMALQARDAGLQVVLATIPPTTLGEGNSIARVQQFNAELTGWAHEEGFSLLDYYAALVAKYPGDTVDGIHPSALGYELMSQQIVKN